MVSYHVKEIFGQITAGHFIFCKQDFYKLDLHNEMSSQGLY